MSTTSKSGSRKKIFLITLLTLLIVAFLAVGYWNTHKKTIVKEKVTEAVHNKTNGVYAIEYGDMKMDELKGNLAITNISIKYDSVKVSTLTAAKKVAPILFNIHIDSLIATGIKTPRALLEKELVAANLTLVNPAIEIVYTGKEKNKKSKEPSKEIYEQILGNLKLIKVDSINIQKGSLVTREISGKEKQMIADDLSIVMNNILVDSTTANDSTRIFFAKQNTMMFNKITLHSSGGLYNYTAKHIAVNTKTHQMHVDTFLVTPQFSEESLKKVYNKQHDRYNFAIHNINIENIDFYKLFNNGQIIANKASLNNSSFKIYRDLTVLQDTISKVGNFPQQLLIKMDIPVNIASIDINDCFIEYKEKNQKTLLNGIVEFYKVNATIDNVTNIKEAIKKNNQLTVNVKSDFMDKVPVSVKWKMYLMHTQGKFSVDGSLAGFDGRELNKLTEPMGSARVESCNIKKLNFSLTGNDNQMDGTVCLLYDNLKVSLLEKDDNGFKKKGFKSLIANFAIKNANPQPNGEVRTASVHYQRDKTCGIFNLIWKSIFTGVKANVGIKK